MGVMVGPCRRPPTTGLIWAALTPRSPAMGGYEALVTRGGVGMFLDGGGKGTRRDEYSYAVVLHDRRNVERTLNV